MQKINTYGYIYIFYHVKQVNFTTCMHNILISEAAHVAKHASTHTSTPPELCGLINQYGGTTIGSFFEPSRSPIRNSIRAMFFDATHDRDLSHIEVLYYLFVCLVGTMLLTCSHDAFGMSCQILLWCPWQDVLLAAAVVMMN